MGQNQNQTSAWPWGDPGHLTFTHQFQPCLCRVLVCWSMQHKPTILIAVETLTAAGFVDVGYQARLITVSSRSHFSYKRE